MRILTATNSYPLEKNPTHRTFVKNTVQSLRDHGAIVDVIYNPYFQYFKSDFQTGNKFQSLLKILFLAAAYFPSIFWRARNYDILFSHAAILPGLLMAIPHKLFSKPHIIYAHGGLLNYKDKKGLYYKLARYALSNATTVLTNSHYMKQQIEEVYQCSCNVIYPGYNSTQFYYEETEKIYDLFYAGWAAKHKGLDLLLNAIQQNKEFYKENKLKVKISTSGKFFEHYRSIIIENSLSEIIEYGERLTETELADTYRKSRLFIFPSRFEPHGLVGIEAIACGTLLVASDTGGIREYLEEEKNGLLFKNNDAADLQKKIKKALEIYPQFMEKQPAPSQTVKRFSLETVIPETIRFFESVVKN